MEPRKELCGKNVFFIFENKNISMYGKKRKTGEIFLNDEGNIVKIKIYNKKYAQNIVYLINLHKEIRIDDLEGFPAKYFYLNQIKERIHPDILLKYAIKAKSTKLVKYAIEREASYTEETLIESAKYCSSILLLHPIYDLPTYEKAMDEAFKSKNYISIKLLAKKIKNLGKYIEMCNDGQNYENVKKILIQEMVRKHAVDK